MMAVKAAYPASKILEDIPSMEFWFEMIKDIDYKVAQNAVKEYICTNTFPPSIADIRKLCRERTVKGMIGFEQAWGVINRAISLYGNQNPTGAYGYMDQQTGSHITAEIAKNLGWTEICMTDNPMATRANFRMAYERKIEEEQKKQQLPENVRTEKQSMIAELVQKTAKQIGTTET